MQENTIASELQRLPMFVGESPEAITWIASLMEERRYQIGDVLVDEGDLLNIFVVLLEGEIHFQVRGFNSVFIMEAGEVSGLLPFSRAKTWSGRGWAVQPSRLVVMDGVHLRELVYRAPILAQRLVSEMTDRAREFTRIEEGSSRLMALGKLAAGLAHELNNPAAAAVRSAARLREVLRRRRGYGIALRAEVIPKRALEVMSDLSETIEGCAASTQSVDALEQADRESDLADWLAANGAPEELASGLAAAGIRVAQLEPVTALTSSHVLTLGLSIIAADYEILCLTDELEEASRRVSDLVQAVKSYSYMDQGAVSEVDIEHGLESTLRMFQHQLKHGAVQVQREYAADLPRIRANGSALNQIWTNLIDNSLDALESSAQEGAKVLTVRTCKEPTAIVVEIGDNGPGIPADVQSRIFEPFFTTKAVGEGTGLGLDIAQRIIRDHKGSIRVESQPGRTFFQVRLPRR